MDAQVAKSPEPPCLELASFRIWVHGRQFPDSLDFWDGNWLNITAQCDAPGALVSASGAILHLSELQDWYTASERLYETLTGEATLKCIEPALFVSLKAQSRGRMALAVEITPDHMTQQHRFTFDIDQSYLPTFLSQCKAILTAYPMRDPKQRLPIGSVTHS
jgi:hypothetical protein